MAQSYSIVTGIVMQSGDSISGLVFLALVVIVVIALFAIIIGRVRRKDTVKRAGAAGARVASGGREKTDSAGHYAKRCPTCKSIYADETLAFCLSDGSTLERVPAPTRQRDPNATLVYADAPRSNLAPTVQSNPEEPPKS